MKKIFRTKLAEADFVDIWLYTYNNWGEVQADKYIDELNKSLKILVEQPLICRERKEFSPPVRIYRYLEHLIIYVIYGDEIKIIRVLHKSMDVENHI
ncbi:MAG: type II toxin-antitoxin system RelE/ParE family toxin [Proteobacteria bacterium]|nr:type II toxin-antitoxin system RelE/ParE family toxin [Pseudomonadota bacterium]